MSSITLRDISLDNYREAVRLKVADSQAGFVASNVESIAWSRYIPNLIPKGIYDGDTMVGFALFGSWGNERPGLWGIARIMVGEQFQGKGYGKAAMQEIVRQIKELDPQTKGIALSYVPGNEAASKLYASLGFRETGEKMAHEIVAQFDYPVSEQAEAHMGKSARSVEVRELTLDTWREAANLDVSDNQRGFVASNLRSIALARYLPEWIPAGIYEGDTPVGFVFFGKTSPHKWHIMRFMIDKNYQGRGYGKAAMYEIIRTIKEKAPDCHIIDLSYVPGNEVARKLYASVGFKETGEMHGGEVVAALDLDEGRKTMDG